MQCYIFDYEHNKIINMFFPNRPNYKLGDFLEITCGYTKKKFYYMFVCKVEY